MKPISVFEYEAKRFDWNDRHIALVERLRKQFGTEVLRLTVKQGQRVVQAAQLPTDRLRCSTLRCGDGSRLSR